MKNVLILIALMIVTTPSHDEEQLTRAATAPGEKGELE